MPLYVDKLTSNDSNVLVREHLKECDDCNRVYNAMKQDVPIVVHNEDEPSENTEKQLMKRIKKRKVMSASSLIIIFSVLGFILGAFVYYWNNAMIVKVKNIPITLKNRNIETNPAEKIQLKSSIWKSYKVDNKNFKPGYYDITAIKGDVDIQNVHLKKGDQYLGAQFYSNNVISVGGKGIIKLTPAEFKKEPLENGVYILNNKSVKYQAGVEIEPGTYQVQIENHTKNPFWVFAQVYSDNPSQSQDIRNSKACTFSVKEGEILEISNWSKEDTDLTVKMKLVK